MDPYLLGIMQSLDDTPTVREGFERAPFPYIGAKNRSAEHLVKYLPYDEVWVDAFGGSGAVTLMRRPSRLEIFNDKHAGIVSFYRCVRNKQLCDQLVERLSLTVHSREEFTWCRDTWESYDLNDDVERAARWYYMQVYSFGGAGRQFGRELRSVTGTSFAGRIHACLSLFQDIHERFKHVQVECLDWRLILRDYGNGPAVVYLDPPYYGKNVYPHSMTKADHVELCQRIFDCSGFVALSGYDNEVYNAFPWDRKESWSAHVSVSGKAVNTDTSGYTELGSSNAVECLWIKERE